MINKTGKLQQFHDPVNNPVVTSKEGWRTLNGKPNYHPGVDFVSADRSNRQVFSLWDGVVVHDFDHYIHSKRFSDSKHSAGNFIIIKHIIDGKAYYIRYIHLIKNNVKIRQAVKRGQVVGEYADAGYSFGAHLHLDCYDYKWKRIKITPVLKEYGIL